MRKVISNILILLGILYISLYWNSELAMWAKVLILLASEVAILVGLDLRKQ